MARTSFARREKHRASRGDEAPSAGDATPPDAMRDAIPRGTRRARASTPRARRATASIAEGCSRPRAMLALRARKP
jgi:hypothetical protein